MVAFREAVRLYPALRKGGIDTTGLRLLARKWGMLRNLRVEVEMLPWPFRASLQRVGLSLTIFVDSRQDHDDRRYWLAHEVGHLLSGHYTVQLHEECETWYAHEGPGDDEYESEANAFAMFACRSQGLPAEWWTSSSTSTREE